MISFYLVASNTNMSPSWLRPSLKLRDLLCIKQITQDPWLTWNDDELVEESETNDKLRLNCATDSYRKSQDEHKLLTKLAGCCMISIDQVEAECEPELPREARGFISHSAITAQDIDERKLFDFDRIWVFGSVRDDIPRVISEKYECIRKFWSLATWKPLSWVSILLVTYLTLKFTIMSYFMYEHDMLLNKIDFELLPNATKSTAQTSTTNSKICIVANHLLAKPREKYLRIQEINQLFDWFGATYTTIVGIGVITINVLASVAFSFYFVAFLRLRNHRRIELEHSEFMANPCEVRARMRRRLEKIVDSIKESLCGGTKIVFIQTKLTSMPTTPSDCSISTLLSLIVRLNLVKPFNLTSCWHWCLINLSLFYTRAGFSISLIFSIISLSCLALYEVRGLTLRRIDQIKCQLWRHDAISLDEDNLLQIPLTPMENNDEIEAYKRYVNSAGNLSTFLYLWFLVETKYYLSYARILYSIEILALTTLYSIWATYYTSVYVVGYSHQLIWLIQLERQICDCIQVNERHKHLLIASSIERKLPLDRKQQRLKNNSSWLMSKQYESTLLELSLICYLNYELFRRSHIKFQRLANFLLSQVSVLVGTSFIVCYVIANNLNAKIILPILYTTLAIVLLFNIYLGSMSYKSKKIERIMRDLVRLLASCPTGEIQNSRPIAMWRRQILTDHEAQEIFSSSVFNIYMSYEKMISINAYMLALWLIVLTKVWEQKKKNLTPGSESSISLDGFWSSTHKQIINSQNLNYSSLLSISFKSPITLKIRIRCLSSRELVQWREDFVAQHCNIRELERKWLTSDHHHDHKHDHLLKSGIHVVRAYHLAWHLVSSHLISLLRPLLLLPLLLLQNCTLVRTFIRSHGRSMKFFVSTRRQVCVKHHHHQVSSSCYATLKLRMFCAAYLGSTNRY